MPYLLSHIHPLSTFEAYLRSSLHRSIVSPTKFNTSLRNSLHRSTVSPTQRALYRGIVSSAAFDTSLRNYLHRGTANPLTQRALCRGRVSPPTPSMAPLSHLTEFGTFC